MRHQAAGQGLWQPTGATAAPSVDRDFAGQDAAGGGATPTRARRENVLDPRKRLPTLAEAAGRIAAEDIDEGEEDAVFQDAVERLRAAALKADIEELTAKRTLTAEQQVELARLLTAKARNDARPKN